MKMVDMLSKADKVFDYIVVLGIANDEIKMPNYISHQDNFYYIGPDPCHPEGSQDERIPDLDGLLKQI